MEGLPSYEWEPVLAAPAESELAGRARTCGIRVESSRLLALRRLARDADVVHVHDGRSHALAAALGLKPLVVARRVAFPMRRSVVSRWKYRRADHYIAISNHVRDRLIEAGVPRLKISVIHDGMPLSEALGQGSLVVAPATRDPMKGRTLVEAAAAVAGVGVHFSENLDEDLRRARLFVYLTRAEGLGSAALLAMAAGVPVVASRVGGLPEAVRDGETGLLVQNRPAEIAEAIRTLLQDEGLRRRLGEQARRLVKEEFPVEKMVRETVKIYERVLR
jgi:glycosyl transferase family 1/glycosyl transferase family 4